MPLYDSTYNGLGHLCPSSDKNLQGTMTQRPKKDQGTMTRCPKNILNTSSVKPGTIKRYPREQSLGTIMRSLKN